jgi:hypothetical protein
LSKDLCWERIWHVSRSDSSIYIEELRNVIKTMSGYPVGPLEYWPSLYLGASRNMVREREVKFYRFAANRD